ncbi:Uncharacterised protein [Clostridioides difficile]|uniref:hypothetical protein n=1 Tax=Clostridioides difficile TaxID=1496 RepID=UPI0010284752|nr:hypothetical protein [Clostridioides difficile]VFC53577.1 Uncharacterised protein [Clostridioides difficile]VHX67711.1 Uncharacterised protein [Clostridioides difficile]
MKDNLDDMKLTNVTLDYCEEKRIGKLIIDGVDFSNKATSVHLDFEGCSIPTIKVELVCDEIKLNGDFIVKKDIDKSTEKKAISEMFNCWSK